MASATATGDKVKVELQFPENSVSFFLSPEDASTFYAGRQVKLEIDVD